MDLFPSKRIPSDEVKKDTWKRCEKCHPSALSGLRRMTKTRRRSCRATSCSGSKKFLNANRSQRGSADEILEPLLHPTQHQLARRQGRHRRGQFGPRGGDNATSNCCSTTARRPPASRGPSAATGRAPPRILACKVYAFEPMVPVKTKFVLHGTAGNMWSEYFPNFTQVQYMAYPRACVGSDWTEAKQKNWDPEAARHASPAAQGPRGQLHRQPRPS